MYFLVLVLLELISLIFSSSLTYSCGLSQTNSRTRSTVEVTLGIYGVLYRAGACHDGRQIRGLRQRTCVRAALLIIGYLLDFYARIRYYITCCRQVC